MNHKSLHRINADEQPKNEYGQLFIFPKNITNNHQKPILDNYNNNYNITHCNHRERRREQTLFLVAVFSLSVEVLF